MDTPCVFIVYVGPDNRASQLNEHIGGRTCPWTRGWSFERLPGPEAVAARNLRPDIILIDPGTDTGPDGSRILDVSLAEQWLGQIRSLQVIYPPAVFAVAPEGSDQKCVAGLMVQGFDDVIEWPVSSCLLGLKSKVFIEKRQMAQSLDVIQTDLDRSFVYLDRFKEELKTCKSELAEEKNSLNAALKQVQQMARDRRRLKITLSGIKHSLNMDREGFAEMLYTLIRHRVENNRGHGHRVGRIARFVAGEMGLDEKTLEDLGKAAMLHEIGLLFLSDSSLEMTFTGDFPPKMGGGSDCVHPAGAYDQALMMQYPVKGAELLRLCPGFERQAEMIHRLNENADGTGYPDGLKRRHIPLASKILAGADELENLRDNPEVRDTRGLLAALEQLAGTRLDANVVGMLGKYVLMHLSPENFKVRGVGVEQLEPGMELGPALFTASGTKLFTGGTVLDREAINKILQYHREYPVDATVYIKV